MSVFEIREDVNTIDYTVSGILGHEPTMYDEVMPGTVTAHYLIDGVEVSVDEFYAALPPRRGRPVSAAPEAGNEPLSGSRCEHGLPVTLDCEQCIWAQRVADDQATDEDYDDA